MSDTGSIYCEGAAGVQTSWGSSINDAVRAQLGQVTEQSNCTLEYGKETGLVGSKATLS